MIPRLRLDMVPGSNVYVDKGVGHYFSDLDADLEVLILFDKKPE